MNIRFYLGLCCILAFFSCEKSIEYNPSSVPAPVLYVEGFAGPELGVSIRVQRTLPISADTFLSQNLLINNAFVLLEHMNGAPVKIPFVGKGQYYLPDSLINIQPGDYYRISAKAPGFDSIQSDWTRIPLRPNTRQFHFLPDSAAGLSINGNRVGTGGFQFDDYPGEAVCYTFQMRGIVGNRLGYMECSTQTPGGGNLCPQIQASPALAPVMNGACMDGLSAINVRLEAELTCNIQDTVWRAPTGIEYYFAAADPIFYQYTESNVQPEDLEKGFSEPKLTVTNIHGGFGVFYGINRQTFIAKW